jgi:hypothetical protein
MKRTLSSLVIVGVLGASTSHAQPQALRIHKLEELNWPQIDALDRERTMFILSVGMVEEHGPTCRSVQTHLASRSRRTASRGGSAGRSRSGGW